MLLYKIMILEKLCWNIILMSTQIIPWVFLQIQTWTHGKDNVASTIATQITVRPKHLLELCASGGCRGRTAMKELKRSLHDLKKVWCYKKK